jgi:predicted secreted hydrolase
MTRRFAALSPVAISPVGLRAVAIAVVAIVVAGCGRGPILANPPLAYPTPAPASAPPSPPPDPIAVQLPRDDGPHGRLTEWWYYTGHLVATDGRRFGFEAVVFRGERGAVPPSWAAHLALTDEVGQRFTYAQRSEIGPQVDRSPRAGDGTPTGFDLDVAGLSPALIAAGAPAVAEPWRLAGSDGADSIEAMLTDAEAAAAGRSFGFDLSLRSTKPAALHDRDGFVDFGPAGSSYYYSRTRLEASGSLVLDGERLAVTGIAWFDHQWGDFISVGGGWDWFAINLDDGTDVTLSVVRDATGEPVLGYGTLVDAKGAARHLDPAAFEVSANDAWTSPISGHTYPIDWSIELPGDGLSIRLRPTIVDQELDTRATTGVAYWEGSQVVRATRFGQSLGGEAYVEVTRYGG